MKKVIRLTESDLVRIVKRVIRESEDEVYDEDKELIDKIEGLDDSDLGYSNNPNKGLSVQYDWDDVDEKLLTRQILTLMKKVNPNVDIRKKMMSLTMSNSLAELNDMLYSASQKRSCLTVTRCLKDFFIDNLQMFR